MEPVDDEHTDLSVKLEWPEDPLAEAPVDEPPKPAPEDPIEARLAALEHLIEGAAPGGGHATIDDIAARLDRVASEVVQALRAINDTLQRALKESDASVDRRLRAISTEIQKVVATAKREREIYGSELADEMKAWRRRLPTKPSGKTPALTESSMDELVMRLADEMEIRVVAALKPLLGKKR